MGLQSQTPLSDFHFTSVKVMGMDKVSWENAQNEMGKGLRQIPEALGVVEILEWGRR